jgi:hypothetical protein
LGPMTPAPFWGRTCLSFVNNHVPRPCGGKKGVQQLCLAVTDET